MAATATKKKTKIALQPLGDKVVVERDEVLHGAAAAGDHDDVHLGHGIELAHRLGHGAHRAGALDRDLPHLEVHAIERDHAGKPLGDRRHLQ